jgi:hypothetical protein
MEHRLARMMLQPAALEGHTVVEVVSLDPQLRTAKQQGKKQQSRQHGTSSVSTCGWGVELAQSNYA